MTGFLIRGWNLILPVCVLPACSATSTLIRGATVAARWLHEPQPNQQPASGIGVSTPCGTVSTRRIYVFVPSAWEL